MGSVVGEVDICEIFDQNKLTDTMTFPPLPELRTTHLFELLGITPASTIITRIFPLQNIPN